MSNLPNARDALITSISYLLKEEEEENVNQSSSSYRSSINKSELKPSIPNRKSKNLNKHMVFTCIPLFHPLVWLGQISIATYFHYLFFLLFFDEQMIVWLYSTTMSRIFSNKLNYDIIIVRWQSILVSNYFGINDLRLIGTS